MPLSFFHDRRFWLVLITLLLCLTAWSMTAPATFPKEIILTVPEGAGLQEISHVLEADGLIRSSFWFRTFAIIFGGERGMQAGQYFFDTPTGAPIVAWRIFRGDHRIETIKVTIPEGFTVGKISNLFDERFTFFENNIFLATAPEGYLFPDTYFMPVTATASSTIKILYDNFVRKTSPLMARVSASGKTLEDIVRMASLLEAEAKTKVDRELISDILWRRLKLGMPLQVDSEMGTYEFQGLPKRAINNPGLISIEAALHASSTPYLYFLTGKDGKMHYAKTFEEHKQNIIKYLPN